MEKFSRNLNGYREEYLNRLKEWWRSDLTSREAVVWISGVCTLLLILSATDVIK